MNQLSFDDALAAALPAHDRVWGGYLLERRRGAGKVGPSWKMGAKVHLVYSEWIVGYTDGFTPTSRQMKKGDCFAAHTPCNSNGQHIARPVDSLTIADIDCAKCVKAM